MKTALELAFATHAIANAICDGVLPNRLNHAPSDVNLAAVMPVALIEAEIVRRDQDGSRPMVEVENLLFATWPEFFAARRGPQSESGLSQPCSTLAGVHVP